MIVICPQCKHRLSDNDLWIDNRTCYIHKDVVNQKKYKYDCPKCNYYQSWLVDTSIGPCSKCDQENQRRKTLMSRMKTGEVYDFNVKMGPGYCIEVIPCVHPVEIIFRSDNQQLLIEMSAPRIVELYKKFNRIIPLHFE